MKTRSTLKIVVGLKWKFEKWGRPGQHLLWAESSPPFKHDDSDNDDDGGDDDDGDDGGGHDTGQALLWGEELAAFQTCGNTL